jgi:hypothetical protein
MPNSVIDFTTREPDVQAPVGPEDRRAVPHLVSHRYIQLVRERPRVRSYRLESSRNPVFDLASEYDREAKHWVVWDRPTGIFGSGDDVLSALIDFQRAARDHFEVLEQGDAGSDDLAWQREYLRPSLHHPE